MTPLSAIPPFTSVGPRAAQAFDELDDKLAEHEVRLNQINSSYEVLGKRQGEIRGSFDAYGGDDGSAPLLENAAEYGNLPGESGFNGVELE